MKKQLDVRVLLVYLLVKLMSVHKESKLLHPICILLSKQITAIQVQERLNNSTITLCPLDTTLLQKEEYSLEELSLLLPNLLKDLEVIVQPPYNNQPLFDIANIDYIRTNITFVLSQLNQIKNES